MHTQIMEQLPSSRPTPHAAPEVPTGRPVGVIALAVLCFVGALIAGWSIIDSSGYLNQGGLLQFVLSIVLAPALLALAFGLWRLRMWARWGIAAFLVLVIVYFVGLGVLTTPITSGLQLAINRSLVPAAVLLYVLHPAIGNAFRRSHARS